MDRKSKDGMPRYQQIALDIATQIVTFRVMPVTGFGLHFR